MSNNQWTSFTPERYHLIATIPAYTDDISGAFFQWPSTPWSPFLFTGPQLSTPNNTIGFLGFGRIARATLARLISFNISRVIYTRSSPPNSSSTRDTGLLSMYPGLTEARHVTTEELARESDFIFVLAPGGEASHHLVGQDFLARMKRTAVLVNPGRGGFTSQFTRSMSRAFLHHHCTRPRIL